MELARYFDAAISKIGEHPTYSVNMQAASQSQQPLILNYHTHGPGQGYCASICVREALVPGLDVGSDLRELVHLRGIGREEDECDVLMAAFAERLVEHYALDHEPVVWLNGAPREGP
jgi:hypothetical protein